MGLKEFHLTGLKLGPHHDMCDRLLVSLTLSLSNYFSLNPNPKSRSAIDSRAKEFLKFRRDIFPGFARFFYLRKMAYSHIRDFMFCEMCGTMLSFKDLNYVGCPLCKFKKPVKDVAQKTISYVVTAKDIQRELGISPSFEDFEVEKEAKQMDYNAKCKNCQNVGMSYVTMQTRSADEGQTIFYTCPKCGTKQTENS